MGSTGRACCTTVSPTRECWRILTACGRELQHVPHVLSHSLTHTGGWSLSASDGIWNMLFSTYSHTSHGVRFSGCLMLFSTYSHTFKRVRSNGCLSPVVAQASAICSNCLHRSPNSPFAFSRLANLTHAVAARLRLRSSPRALSSRSRSGGMWTQIVYDGKTDRVHPHGPLFPRQLMSHTPTHWITPEALLDMIDAIDTDMNARPGDAELIPWLPVLDSAPQHVAKEFRSIMRDTRSHVKLCYVQRNFTACT